MKDVLDAAHLPEKDWRKNHQAEDGVLLRVDLYRLIDRRLAEFKDGKFWLDKSLRAGDYAAFHRKVLELWPAS